MKLLVLLPLVLLLFSPGSLREELLPANDPSERIEDTDYSQEKEFEVCCYWRGGVCGCTDWGQVLCCDGTLSLSCSCDPQDNDLYSRQP